MIPSNQESQLVLQDEISKRLLWLTVRQGCWSTLVQKRLDHGNPLLLLYTSIAAPESQKMGDMVAMFVSNVATLCIDGLFAGVKLVHSMASRKTAIMSSCELASHFGSKHSYRPSGFCTWSLTHCTRFRILHILSDKLQVSQGTNFKSTTYTNSTDSFFLFTRLLKLCTSHRSSQSHFTYTMRWVK